MIKLNNLNESSKRSPSVLKSGDCFTDDYGDSYKVIDIVHKDSRVELEVENTKGSITKISYIVAGGCNDRITTITDNEFNSLKNQSNKSKSNNNQGSHVIYMIPSKAINNRDIKYLNSNGKFTYTQQTAKLFTRDEAKEVLARLNKSKKENVYKYGMM